MTETKRNGDGVDLETGSVTSLDARSQLGNDIHILGINYFKNNFGCFPCVNRYSLNDFTTVYNAITHLNTLDNYQKNIVLVRFNRICHFINKEYFLIKWCYTLSKLFVIMTGIIAPALMSINVQTDTFWYAYIYWIVWTIQIIVSLTTAFASFYKWDKKYFIYKAYKTKIEQELWLYLELIGRYGIINKKCNEEAKRKRTSHKTKLNLFLSRLEILFKRLKDADLDIEITEDDNQSKEGDNTRPTTVIPNATNSNVGGGNPIDDELADPLTDGKDAEDLSDLLMSKQVDIKPPGDLPTSNEKFNSTKRPEPVKPPSPTITDPGYTEDKNRISPTEFTRLSQEWKREKEYAREAEMNRRIIERDLMDERRISEDYKRENEEIKQRISDMSKRYRERYESDVLRLKEKMERHTNIILKYSNELDSIIKVQYLVRKYLKNKKKK